MERRIILDFIAFNYKVLKEIDFNHFNIYLYGKKYSNNSIASSLLNGDQIFAYDIKFPRINSKTLDFEKYNCGILDFANQFNETMCFKYEDFSFELEDVYSKKDIRNLNFKYLYFVPIIKEDKKNGLFIFFAEKFIENFKLNASSVTVLYNNLQSLEINCFEQNVIKSLVNYNDYYFILRENLTNDVILSDSLKDKWKLNSKTNFDNELVNSFMNHHQVKEKKLSFPFEKYKIFYIDKKTYDDVTNQYLHVNALNNLNIANVFTLIAVDFSQYQESFIDVVHKFNFNRKYYVFASENDFYLLFIESKISASIFKKMFNDFDCYHLILNAPTDINNKMDFGKILSYIKNIRPDHFAYKEYLNYINELNTDLLEVNLNEYKTREIICSFSKKKIANLLNFVPLDFKYENTINEFERKTISKLNNYLKVNDIDVWAAFISGSLLKRKVVEVYKKYFNKNIELSIIVHYNHDLNKNEFYDAISICKQYNVKLYADSSIFLNLELVDLMRYFDGCYVRQNEFVSIQNAPNKFVNVFVSYYFNENKTIVFEETQNKELNQRYEDELIYFVKESEGK